MSLEPLEDRKDLAKVGKKSRPQFTVFRLTDYIRQILEDQLVVTRVFFAIERVQKTVEQVDKGKKGLTAHRNIVVLRHMHEIGQ